MAPCVMCGDLNEPGFFKLYRPCRASNGRECDPCLRADLLFHKILEAKSVLEELLEQHREVRSQINHVHDSMTRILPFEVTCHIFQFSVPNISHPFHVIPDATTDHRKQAAVPWTLGAVCRTWRQLVWSSPPIWSIIHFDCDKPDLPSRLTVLQDCLTRSGQVPLNIQLYSTQWYIFGQTSEEVCAAIDLLNQHYNRWQKLCVFLLASYFSKLGGPRTMKSNLREIFLWSTPNNDEAEIFAVQDNRPAPKIVKLSSMLLDKVHIKWDGVVHFEGYSMHLDECMKLLRQAPALRHLTLQIILAPRGVSTSGLLQSVTHYSLQQLSILGLFLDHEPATPVNLLLDLLLLPSLAHVHRSEVYDLRNDPILPLLNKHTSTLSELTLTSVYSLNDSQLIPFLRGYPLLRLLHLEPNQGFSFSPGPLFELLSNTSLQSDTGNSGAGTDTFLPGLELLEFFYPPINHFQSESAPWLDFFKIFGPLDDNATVGLRRRPLKTVIIHISGKHFDLCLEKTDEKAYLSKSSTVGALRVRKAGFQLRVGDFTAGKDLIELSRIHHRLTSEGKDMQG